ncbi:MAG: NAD(P)/FAD-dependent oxidoreductase, partial [Amphiplicatus sp.]
MTETITADLCVIGAGAAGLSVAAGAAQLGRKTVLIEKGAMGGDCLNFGCVPSKALIAAASHAAAIRAAPAFGVEAGAPAIDFAAVMDHVHKVIAEIAPHDSAERFEGLGVKVIRARGAFIGPREAKAGDAFIRAKHFVIATGSSPLIPPIEGLADIPYLTNETVFGLRAPPDHLLIIGGGAIGAELAQAFRRLGPRVTLVEEKTLLGREDPEAVDLLRRALLAEGVALLEGERVKSVRRENNETTLDLGGRRIAGSHLLLAAGRRTEFDGLGLDKAGVATERGALRLDRRLRTTNPRIYAAGDAAGGAFTHVAGDHASTLIRNILFKIPAKRRDDLSPRVTYADPEIAAIGLSLAEARKIDKKAREARWSLSENDRARTDARADGFVKLVISRGRVLGASIVGKGAGDMIDLVAFAIANRMRLSAFTNYIAPYPTRGEAIKRAAGAAFTDALFSARTRALVRLLG